MWPVSQDFVQKLEDEGLFVANDALSGRAKATSAAKECVQSILADSHVEDIDISAQLKVRLIQTTVHHLLRLDRDVLEAMSQEEFLRRYVPAAPELDIPPQLDETDGDDPPFSDEELDDSVTAEGPPDEQQAQSTLTQTSTSSSTFTYQQFVRGHATSCHNAVNAPANLEFLRKHEEYVQQVKQQKADEAVKAELMRIAKAADERQKEARKSKEQDFLTALVTLGYLPTGQKVLTVDAIRCFMKSNNQLFQLSVQEIDVGSKLSLSSLCVSLDQRVLSTCVSYTKPMSARGQRPPQATLTPVTPVVSSHLTAVFPQVETTTPVEKTSNSRRKQSTPVPSVKPLPAKATATAAITQPSRGRTQKRKLWDEYESEVPEMLTS